MGMAVALGGPPLSITLISGQMVIPKLLRLASG